MPRQGRRTPGGLVYHVLNRAVGRMRLFESRQDYAAFEEIIRETLKDFPMRICAFCIMPNHWHFVLWPEGDEDLSRFMQRLTVTHAMRWLKNRRSIGTGHVYQGRFKSFPVETDEHFYHVVRYAERNALRAGLVSRAEKWRWSSGWLRSCGTPMERQLLSAWPLRMPGQWIDFVNQPQSDAELAALRLCVERGQPYGRSDWVRQTAAGLGLNATLRGRGRPRGERPFG